VSVISSLSIDTPEAVAGAMIQPVRVAPPCVTLKPGLWSVAVQPWGTSVRSVPFGNGGRNEITTNGMPVPALPNGGVQRMTYWAALPAVFGLTLTPPITSGAVVTVGLGECV
jgi:hypothetical protein